MVVFVLEDANDKLRGMLTRWTIEPKYGVFVGALNAMVRDKIWEMISDNSPRGALMIYSCNNEQGYHIELLGNPSRITVDLDGLQLIKIK